MMANVEHKQQTIKTKEMKKPSLSVEPLDSTRLDSNPSSYLLLRGGGTAATAGAASAAGAVLERLGVLWVVNLLGRPGQALETIKNGSKRERREAVGERLTESREREPTA